MSNNSSCPSLLSQKIGSGSFGKVYKKGHYAFKIVEAPLNSMETDINAGIFGCGVVNSYDIKSNCENFEDKLVIKYDLFDSDLYDHYKTNLKDLPEDQLYEKMLNYYIDCLISLKCLHRAGFIHLDIKAENILYDSNNDRCFISDFGLAAYTSGRKFLQPMAAFTSFAIPPEYYSTKIVSYVSDLYSLACGFLTLLFVDHSFYNRLEDAAAKIRSETLYSKPSLYYLIKNKIMDPNGKIKPISELGKYLNKYDTNSPIQQKFWQLINYSLKPNIYDRKSASSLLRLSDYQDYIINRKTNIYHNSLSDIIGDKKLDDDKYEIFLNEIRQLIYHNSELFNIDFTVELFFVEIDCIYRTLLLHDEYTDSINDLITNNIYMTYIVESKFSYNGKKLFIVDPNKLYKLIGSIKYFRGPNYFYKLNSLADVIQYVKDLLDKKVRYIHDYDFSLKVRDFHFIPSGVIIENIKKSREEV